MSSRGESLKRGVLGLLRRDLPRRGVTATDLPRLTTRTLAALDGALTGVAPGSNRLPAAGRRDPLLVWLEEERRRSPHLSGLPSPLPARPPPIAREGLRPTREAIRKIVVESSAAIRLCYERALITSPRAREGTILLRWEISPSGQTTHVQVIRDALAMETLTRCLVAQVRSWIFPPCSGSCTVTYPFEFFTQA